MRNPPGGNAAPRSILGQSPSPGPGAFFSRPAVTHFPGPLPVYALHNESILADRVLNRSHFREAGLSESNSISFRAHSNVAAKRIAYFRSSVMGVSRRWVAG
jgi:hypothetical protein